MRYLTNITRVLLVVLGIFCIITVIFAITARDQWWIRVFDYPRLQIALLSLGVLVLASILLEWKKTRIKLFFSVLMLAVLYQGYILHPYYLPVSRVVPDYEITAPERTFSLLVSNILMENKEVQAYLDLVAKLRPDVVLVMEPNDWWTKQLAPLRKIYTHHVEQPQDNQYGMNLYSRFPLSETKIHYFEDTGTPSIQTLLQLPSGDKIVFYGTHPRPPLPENSVSAADKELLIIAKRAREAERPVVVAGDFNDVPWSFTVKKFQEISQLRDIRVGRGFYNTFNAQSLILRLPIDHIFISPGIGLIHLENPVAYTSDHMALFVRLVVDERVAKSK